MRVTIPICRGRITPVFDVAHQLFVYDVESKSVLLPREHTIHSDHTSALVELGIDVLICAAISRELECHIEGLGIKVITGVCGRPERVINAYVNDRLGDRDFAMPGRGRGRGQGRCRLGQNQGRGLGRRRRLFNHDQNQGNGSGHS